MNDSSKQNQPFEKPLELSLAVKLDLLKMRALWVTLLVAQLSGLYLGYDKYKVSLQRNVAINDHEFLLHNNLYIVTIMVAVLLLIVSHSYPRHLNNLAKKRFLNRRISGSMTLSYLASFTLGSLCVSSISVLGFTLTTRYSSLSIFLPFFIVGIIGVLLRFPTPGRIEKTYRD